MESGKVVTGKRPSKKETRKEVFEKLSGALAQYKGNLSEKKFRTKLEKATRLFATDIFKAIKKDHKSGQAREKSRERIIVPELK